MFRMLALVFMALGFGGAALLGLSMVDWTVPKERAVALIEQVKAYGAKAVSQAEGTVTTAFTPPPPPPPPARFLQRDMMGMRALLIAQPVYEPSEQITRAAILHQADGGRTWYALPPATTPPTGVVVLLHGSDRDGRSMLDMWQAAARQNNLTLVAPNSGKPNWARDGGDLALVQRALQEATTLYGAPTTGTFIFGHSDGAAFAQEVLNRAPHGVWTGGAVHGGHTAPARLTQAKTATPFRIFLGSQDHAFSVEGANASGQAMAKAGHPTELMVIPGHTHWYYQIGPRLSQTTWLWFADIAKTAPAQ